MATKSKKLRTKWFSRILKIRGENEGLTIDKKQKKAESDCRKMLAKHPKGALWRIPSDGFKWEKLKAPDKRYRLTVFIEFKSDKVPGPSDAPVPAPKSPPPSM